MESVYALKPGTTVIISHFRPFISSPLSPSHLLFLALAVQPLMEFGLDPRVRRGGERKKQEGQKMCERVKREWGAFD